MKPICIVEAGSFCHLVTGLCPTAKKLAYFIIVLNLGLHELSAFESSRLDVNSLTRFYVVIINKVIYPQFELIS
jgi:hypothetical protein